MKLQNIALVSLLTLLSIELLPRSLRDFPASRKRIVDGALDLSRYRLTSLEGLNEIEGWRNLQALDLSDNQLSSLPAWIGDLTNLRELNLGNNQLTALPNSIDNLRELQKLYLNHNQLRTLPEEIGSLVSLHDLYLDSNLLTALPDSIGNLRELQALYLNHNQLRTLPEEIGSLASLQWLDLFHNQLIALPDSIGNLRELQELGLGDNEHLPLTTIRSIRLAFARRGAHPRIYLRNEQAVPFPAAEDISPKEIEEAMKELATSARPCTDSPRHTTHVAQQSPVKKKQRAKVATRIKKEKVAVA